jgi:hypothetical protein
MEARTTAPRLGGFTVLGLLLVIGGLSAFAAQQAGFDLMEAVRDAGWPLFVIAPGIALLVASLFQRPPHGLGFAIPGGIVTMVGLVLFYQQSTGHWESWAYAWALVGPGGAGLATLLYGLLYREQKLIGDGLRLTVISALLFAVGFWYFETIFATGRVPIDLGAWWPLALVALGIAALAVGILNVRRTPPDATPATTTTGDIR